MPNPCIDPCQTGCDSRTGECITLPDGSACDDLDICTVNDRCVEGYCEGVAPGEEPTFTPTPTVTETPTPSQGVTPTDTPTQGQTSSPTPDERPCTGDCDGSVTVTIDELITGVRIALGEQGVATCSALDGNSDGSVTIDELVTAVRAALEGCAAIV